MALSPQGGVIRMPSAGELTGKMGYIDSLDRPAAKADHRSGNRVEAERIHQATPVNAFETHSRYRAIFSLMAELFLQLFLWAFYIWFLVEPFDVSCLTCIAFAVAAGVPLVAGSVAWVKVASQPLPGPAK